MKSNFAVRSHFMPGAGRSAAGIGVVVLAAATIAATPGFAQAQPATIDAADTAWMIVATGLVLMMTIPGLALFYCGMVRKKNVLATMAPSLLCTMLGSLLWVAVGYSLVFSGDGPLIGDLGRVLLRGIGMDTVAAADADPRDAVHALPDDLRGHHGGAGRRLGGRSHAVYRLRLVRGAVAHLRLCADRALGLGRRLSHRHRRPAWRPRFRRRHRRPSQCGRRRPGRRLCDWQAPGLRQRKLRAVRSVARRDRHRAALGRLVRLQRRLGVGRQFARGVRHRRDPSRGVGRGADLDGAGMVAARQAVGARHDLRARLPVSERSRRRRASCCRGRVSSSA